MTGANGSELPQLELEGMATRKTNEHGRASFGDISIAEGSGRVGMDENSSSNRQNGAMELLLVCEVAGLGGVDARWAHSGEAFLLYSCCKSLLHIKIFVTSQGANKSVRPLAQYLCRA